MAKRHLQPVVWARDDLDPIDAYSDLPTIGKTNSVAIAHSILITRTYESLDVTVGD